MKAIVTIEEITALSQAKASGLAMSIYMILAAHDWQKGVCFPSIGTISKRLGGAYAENSIHRCLKWLEDRGFIKRNEAKSKSRFVMLLRKVKAAAKAVLKGSSNKYESQSNKSVGRRTKQRKKNITYSKNASQRRKKNIHQRRRRIGDWINAMTSVQSLRDMRSDDQYAPLLEGLNLEQQSFEYPPKPQESWDLSEVKQAFIDYGHGRSEDHWVFAYYMKHYGVCSEIKA